MVNNEKMPFDDADLIGFWKRVLAVLLDMVILLIPAVLLYGLFGLLSFTLRSEIPTIVGNFLFIIIEIFMIVRFGGTPGKLILKIRIINEGGEYPTLKQALVRKSFLIMSAIVSISLWADQTSVLSDILTLIIIVDYLFVAFHPRKRALHDMMAGTYVVYRSKY